MEEWDTNSLQIVERNEVNAACSSPSMPPLLHDLEGEDGSAEMTYDRTPGDTEDATGDIQELTSTDIQQPPPPPPVFAGGYTTMEMFQQAMPQGDSKSVETDLAGVTSGLDYVRQSSTSWIVDDKDVIL